LLFSQQTTKDTIKTGILQMDPSRALDFLPEVLKSISKIQFEHGLPFYFNRAVIQIEELSHLKQIECI